MVELKRFHRNTRKQKPRTQTESKQRTKARTDPSGGGALPHAQNSHPEARSKRTLETIGLNGARRGDVA